MIDEHDSYSEWRVRIKKAVCQPIVEELGTALLSPFHHASVIYNDLPSLYLAARVLENASTDENGLTYFRFDIFANCFQFCDIADMLAEHSLLDIDVLLV